MRRKFPDALQVRGGEIKFDNVVFASDTPFDPTPGLYIRETIQVIESLDLSANQKDQIFRRNAEKLLKIG